MTLKKTKQNKTKHKAKERKIQTILESFSPSSTRALFAGGSPSTRAACSTGKAKEYLFSFTTGLGKPPRRSKIKARTAETSPEKPFKMPGHRCTRKLTAGNHSKFPTKTPSIST
eukprot:Lithocolla_globosa_v1_NODE_1656_length_2412_cov_443.264831.p3 type:complete len:114 gc:universal NODE_1656_length_2412_cov_443.264831:2226-1885(-)